MSRQIKNGVDYFPLDVSLDEKFELIEAEFGLTGFAVIVKLYQRIYSRGYYCEWTDEVALLFARACGLGVNVVSEIVSASIRRGIFDKALFDKYRILTSVGIQKRYFGAVSRRQSVEVDEGYLLIECAEISKYVNINRKNVDRNPKNVSKKEQRKEEKRKEENSKEKSKEKKLAIPTEIQDAWQAYGEMRKRIGKPLTPYAEKLALKRLDELAPGDLIKQAKILERSVFHSWQGLFSLKEDDHKTSGGQATANNGSFNTDDFFEAAMRRSMGQNNEHEGG